MKQEINFFPEKFLILHKSLVSYFNSALKDSDMSAGYVFYFLLLAQENMTQAQLSQRSKRDKAHTNRVVSQLIEKGYLEYEDNNIKNRKIKLTSKGMEFAEYCKKLFKEYIKNLFSGIDKNDLETTSKVLTQLINNAKTLNPLEDDND